MATNDITGAKLISKNNTKAFENNFDAIFVKDKQEEISVSNQTLKYLFEQIANLESKEAK